MKEDYTPYEPTPEEEFDFYLWGLEQQIKEARKKSEEHAFYCLII